MREVVGQPVFLASVSIMRVSVEGRNEAADMDQLHHVITRVTEIGYMSIYACANTSLCMAMRRTPKATQVNFRGQDPSF